MFLSYTIKNFTVRFRANELGHFTNGYFGKFSIHFIVFIGISILTILGSIGKVKTMVTSSDSYKIT